MPFIDLNTKEAGSFSIPQSDVTIIGAGAAGILLAIRLTREGNSVVLLESGHFLEDEAKQKLNEVEQTGKIVQNAVWGRKRAIGGTTIAWGGQSLPFTAIDFATRAWVQNSGWPISFAEVAKYYPEANNFMGIDTMNYSTDIFPKILLKNPGIDSTIFDFHVSKWAVKPNFYELYKDELEKNVTVIYNAQVISIIRGGIKSISSIIVSNFNKIKFTFPIKNLIITAGTIETVRLLLNNNIGNHSGWLGKAFMEHPCIEVGTISSKKSYVLQRYFNTHIWKGHKYSVRLSLNKNFLGKKKLLNCSASIMFQFPQETFDPYGELKSFKRDFKLSRLIKISGSFKSIFKSTWAYLIHKFYFKANAKANLTLMVEQEPVRESYITLTNTNDDFGIPKAQINWHITSTTWETVVSTAECLKKEIERLGLGSVNLYDNIKNEIPDWRDYLSDVCHHMGGTKMSAIEDEGVVNTNLQVWGIPNFYICSCSVFPTSSHSNPTLTMLAFAIRLSDHIKNN